ncbi:MAG: hypothetical protein QOH61_2028, partial [Chloroflexota bacterium]|nr:hypothetical protein [Chloroflexota bacterium]
MAGGLSWGLRSIPDDNHRRRCLADHVSGRAAEQDLGDGPLAVGPNDDGGGAPFAGQSHERLGHGDLVGDDKTLGIQAVISGRPGTLLGRLLRSFEHHLVDFEGGPDVDGSNRDGWFHELE